MVTANTTLVFVHGSGDSASVWEPLIALLPEYSTVALDLPGHGALANEPGPPTMSVTDYAAYVGNAITRRGLERPTVIGHSLGGAVAMRLALDSPEQVGRLGLVGTGARLRVAPAFLAAAREAGASGVPIITQASFAAQHSAEAEAFHARRTPTAPGALFRDLSACDSFDVMEDVGHISQPTLIIVGESDRMTPPKFSEYLAARVPTSTLAVIPDAGHYAQVEQPQRVADALRAWLTI
ncbi:MAG TPA: alpha/beta hydrolase [Ktedonobacterales bacterium]|jgi:pimeloyl-ACP methyl ester carboxylesterase|nr:alpha/beta hydrolase [Ktedonobacterales bacterium]